MYRTRCTFCEIVAKEVPAYIIDENEAVIVFLSLENHPLLVPKEHVPDIYTLSDELGARVMAETIRIAKAVKEGLQCDGVYLNQCNGSAAGQDIFHFHLHVRPCWEGGEVYRHGRFVASVTEPETVTDEMKATRMEKIREGLAAL